MLSARVVVRAAESVTRTVNDDVPPAVGVPVMAPVVGSEPVLVTTNVQVPV